MKRRESSRQQPHAGGTQFLITLRHQQHTSWQGSVQRLDTGETVNFRSALELMVLIEGVAGERAAIQQESQERLRAWSKTKEVKEPDKEEKTG